MELWELSAREAVRHTIASYTYAADNGRFDDVAALFAVDGVLEVQGIGGATRRGPRRDPRLLPAASAVTSSRPRRPGACNIT